MNLLEAMEQRHSVRQYREERLSDEHREALERIIAGVNEESGLHIQLIAEEPEAFNSAMAHYGAFSGVRNYIALIGQKSSDLEETCGYYGEKIVLEAQRLGLNTCWVALTYKKVSERYDILPGEKLMLVITVGYGENSGSARRSKSETEVSNLSHALVPDWFKTGLKYALLAPTAVNHDFPWGPT